MARHCTRVDTLELKAEIQRRLGERNANKYFSLLAKFFSLKVRKHDFDKLCIAAIGKENLKLHNHLIRSIIQNALRPGTKTAPVKNKMDDSAITKLSYEPCGDIPKSQKGRTRDLRKFKDLLRMPLVEAQLKKSGVDCRDPIVKLPEKESATKFINPVSRLPSSEEELEDFNWKTIKAPLGVPNLINASSVMTKVSFCDSGCLPSTSALKEILDQRLDGLKVSADCANLLSHGVNTFLKELIKPCLAMARLRAQKEYLSQENCNIMAGRKNEVSVECAEKPMRFISASMLDFRVTAESNPSLLGNDWPIQLERVSLRQSESMFITKTSIPPHKGHMLS